MLFRLNHDEDDIDGDARTATPADITLESLVLSASENISDKPLVVNNDGMVDRLGAITTILESSSLVYFTKLSSRWHSEDSKG